MTKINKKIRFPIALALVPALIITALSFSLTSAADTIDETNPELEFKVIEGVCRDLDWKPEGNSSQNNGIYTIDNNCDVVWYSQDEVAYLYKEYAVGGGPKDVLSVTTTLTSQSQITGIDGNLTASSSLHENASAGIMMRSSLKNNAAEVFLHVRAQRVMMVYRMMDEGGSSAKYTSIIPFYPIELKLEKVGNVYTGYYRKPGEANWMPVASCTALIKGSTYAGIASHTCDQNRYSRSVFTGFTVKGEGTAESVDDSSETQGSSDTPLEDAPVDENVLLRESFSDGDLYSGEESVTNPIWRRSKNNNIITADDGTNRYWHLDFDDTYAFAGDDNWTDYNANVKIQFTDSCDTYSDNIFKFFVRHMENEFSGVNDYAVTVETVNQTNANGTALKDADGNILRKNVIRIYKRQKTAFQKFGTAVTVYDEVQKKDVVYQKDIDWCLGDGKWHNLDVKAFDNCITVWWDGEKALEYMDEEAFVFGRGCIGVYTQNTSVYVDDILVNKLEDSIGGDYDNDVGGLWNEPIPVYVASRLEEYF